MSDQTRTKAVDEKFCESCGEIIKLAAVICPKCGVPQKNVKGTVLGDDTGNIGWRVLGAVIPILGLILYLLWKTDRPKSSKQAGIGAIIGFIVQVVFLMIFSTLYQDL